MGLLLSAFGNELNDEPVIGRGGDQRGVGRFMDVRIAVNLEGEHGISWEVVEELEWQRGEILIAVSLIGDADLQAEVAGVERQVLVLEHMLDDPLVPEWREGLERGRRLGQTVRSPAAPAGRARRC